MRKSILYQLLMVIKELFITIYITIVANFVNSDIGKKVLRHKAKDPNLYKAFVYSFIWQFGIYYWVSDISVLGGIFGVLFSTVICKYVFDWFDKLSKKR